MSGEELKPAACPFCGEALYGPHISDIEVSYWMHPGVMTDGKCFFSGQGIYEYQVAAWNRRAAGKLDWLKVAKLAGEHGIRYRTNRALEQFLAALSHEPVAHPLPEQPQEGVRDREVLLVRLETIQRTIDSWVKWDKEGRDREGLETPGDTYIMQVPVWPTHRQFGVWSETLSKAIAALSPPSTETKESGE